MWQPRDRQFVDFRRADSVPRAKRFLPRLTLVLVLLAAAGGAQPAELTMPMRKWRVVKSESGPVNYYTLQGEGPLQFIRGNYKPPFETTVLGYQVPDRERSRVRWLHGNGAP